MARFILLAICVIAPISPEFCTNAVLGSVAMEALGVTRGNLARGYPTLAGSRRSMGRGIQVAGGQIDKAGQLQIGESGF
jgi:hypothetical protein